MEHRDHFSSYHPLVNFLYFALVLVFTMCLLHPVSLTISLGTALAYCVCLRGPRAVGHSLLYLLPMMILATLINATFNHEGATILTYLPSGNPLTLESILYGLAGSLLLGAVILWFSCYSAVMTSDKFIYLFGRVLPALSLILSMTLRFVPLFREKFHIITEAQRCVGRDLSSGTLLQRIRTAIAILSILVTWALENAIETADSMKGRGYGLPGRTAFSLYRLEQRDRLVLCWLLLCGMYLAYGWAAGYLGWHYYPLVGGAFSPSFHLVHLSLCLSPIILNRKEDRQWTHLRSKT